MANFQRWKSLTWTTGCLLIAPTLAWGQAAGDPGEAAYRAASQLLVGKKFPEAAAAFQKFLVDHAASSRMAEAKLGLAEALLGASKPVEARAELKKILDTVPFPDPPRKDEKNPPPPPPEHALRRTIRVSALLHLARLALPQQLAEALAALNEAFGPSEYDDLNGPVIAVLLGDLQVRLGNDVAAIAAFERVTRWPQYAETPRAYFEIAEAHQRLGQFEDAAVAYRAVVEKYWRHPLAPRAGLAAGDAYLANRDLNAAEREYRRVLQDYIEAPVAPRAQLGLGALAVLRKEFALARAAYQAAALLFTAAKIGPECSLRIADTYRLEGQLDTAAAGYQALFSEPDRRISGEARFALGSLQQDRRQFQAALDLFRPLAADPMFGSWHVLGGLQAAEIQAGAGDRTTSLATLRALQPEPGGELSGRVAVALGEALGKAADWSGAEVEYLRVTQLPRPGASLVPALAGLARCRLERGDTVGALARCQEALDRSAKLTDNSEPRATALLVKGRSLLLLKRGAEAEPVLQEVVDRHGTTVAAPPAARELLQWLRSANQQPRADALEKLIASRYPTSVPVNLSALERAEALARSGKPGEASKEFAAALASPLDRALRIRARAGQAKVQAELGLAGEAQQSVRELIQEAPLDGVVAPVWLSVAGGLERAGKREEALSAYQQTLAARPSPAEAADAMLGAASLEESLRRPQQATTWLHRFLKEHTGSPRRAEALYSLSWLELEAGRREQASGLWTSLVREHPNHPLAPDAAFRLGEFAEQSDNLTEAVERYRWAWTSSQKLTGAGVAARDRWGYRLGWVMRIQGEHRGAATHFAAVAEEYPRSELATECRVRAGEALLQLEDTDAARRHFEAVVKLSAGNVDPELLVAARVGLAHCQLLSGNIDPALTATAELARLQNGWYGGRAALLRGEAQYLKGGPKSAISEFRRASGVFSRFTDLAAEAEYRSAECQAELGGRDAMRAAWQRVVDLFPKTEWGRRAGDRLHALSAAR